jgi:hypothetical protein
MAAALRAATVATASPIPSPGLLLRAAAAVVVALLQVRQERQERAVAETDRPTATSPATPAPQILAAVVAALVPQRQRVLLVATAGLAS